MKASIFLTLVPFAFAVAAACGGSPSSTPTPGPTTVPLDSTLLIASNRTDLAICVDSLGFGDVNRLEQIVRDVEPLLRTAPGWHSGYLGAEDLQVRVNSGCPIGVQPVAGRNCVSTPTEYVLLVYIIEQGDDPLRDHPYGLAVEDICSGDSAFPITNALLVMPNDLCDPVWIQQSIVGALGLDPSEYTSRTPQPCT